jgi:hypothetical protein
MSSFNYAGGTTIYVRQDSGLFQVSTDESNWANFSFPVTVTNTNTAGGLLKIYFSTDLTLSSVNNYFSCGSSHIQFGSTSLKSDGSRPIIEAVNNFDGFIENGNYGVTSGNNNIYIYNIIVSASGQNTQVGGGWIGKKGFGIDATNNYIINCTSTGDLPGGATGSGGIVGAYAGSGSGATLYITGCSGSGSIGQLDGGIVGAFAGKDGGTVICSQCYFTGTIGNFGGGIFGDYAGDNGTVEANKCYTTGAIGSNAGGIYGRYGGNNGSAIASKCYSNGNIGTDGGGIFGIGAGSSSGSSMASNCYSSGIITTAGRGIYGTGKVNGTETNCYAANNNWSDLSANLALTGVPISTSSVGTAWVSTAINSPYELYAIGYTPYTTFIINSSYELIQTYSQIITAGGSTIVSLVADASGNSFIILEKSGGNSDSYNTITMSVQTGAISTTSETMPGDYTIVLRSVGSYNITFFNLTVNSVTVDANVSCCELALNLTGLDYDMRDDIISGNYQIANTSVRRTPMSYTDMLNIKKAYAAKG